MYEVVLEVLVKGFDRVGCNDNWTARLPGSYYQYLPHSPSDHSPVLSHLVTATLRGPKPFRYFNYWMQCERFKDVVQHAWSTAFQGHHMYQVVMKLKKA